MPGANRVGELPGSSEKKSKYLPSWAKRLAAVQRKIPAAIISFFME